MKKLLVLFAAVFFAALPAFAGAATLHAGEHYILAGEDGTSGDLYNAGSDALIEGVVQGDATLAGGTIVITGSVTQDVLAAGGTIKLGGKVTDDARLLGGDITISGSVAGDIAVVGGTVRVFPSAVIGGDLFAFGGTLIIEGQVSGDVRVIGGDVTINGSVGGSVVSYADRLTLGASAVVEGDLTNKSEQQPVLEAGAIVKGEMINEPAPVQPRTLRSILAAAGAMGFLMFLFAGLLCFWFAKNKSSQFVAHSLAHFGKELLRGLILLIALPIAAVLLLVSLIGAPLGIILLLLCVLMFMLAKVFAGIMLGGWINRVIFKKPDQVFTWQTIIGGNVILMLLRLVPVVGHIIGTIFMLVAFGAFWGYAHRHILKTR